MIYKRCPYLSAALLYYACISAMAGCVILDHSRISTHQFPLATRCADKSSRTNEQGLEEKNKLNSGSDISFWQRNEAATICTRNLE